MIKMLQVIREFCKKNSVDVDISFYGNMDYPALVIRMRNKRLCKAISFTDFDLENMEKISESINVILNKILTDLIDATVELLENEKENLMKNNQ